jgi:hypothetical protein
MRNWTRYRGLGFAQPGFSRQTGSALGVSLIPLQHPARPPILPDKARARGNRRSARAFLWSAGWHTEPKRDGMAVGREAADERYDEYRNPFTHALGISVRTQGAKRSLVPRGYLVKVKRRAET